ncbi:hypothetical protein [Leptolinea tardivitalis]|uniref:Heme NO-binding domain-containing protein n=1 Tax=Leptolinea tardivitalis TaxID=229920 RepID=A0A0P6WYJ4_9CHLR|nr:hypothetical protein [Leptolinea tardivitalis]KPL71660.1 hypothetical protein ADM99_09295 [Leptolinea tardivitalis]GAP19997.1 hypothetical protein LTAR_00181 [Leptolinea tardivitalis]
MTDPFGSPEVNAIFQKGIREILTGDQPGAFTYGNGVEIETIQRIAHQAVDTYGFVSACGLFLRSGCAAFKYLVRDYGKAIDIDSLEFRLQPPRKRLMDGIRKVVGLLEHWHTASFSIRQSDDDVEIIMQSNLAVDAQGTNQIWLHFLAGLIQELLYWAGGGKQYPFQILPIDADSDVIIQFRLLPVD